MIKNSKNYILFVICLSLILITSISIFNFVADPLNLFNKENNVSSSKAKIFYEKVLKSKHGVYFDDTKFNMRDIKQYFALNNLNKECAVIGSSVTDMINGSLSDTDMDNGMGEVILQQPEPFDIYVDPKSRDMMFRDASYVLIRKVLPKSHVAKLFPHYKRKINSASSLEGHGSYSERALSDREQKLFLRDDSNAEDMGVDSAGEHEPTLELFELYEKVKISYMNVFYRIPPNKEQLKAIQQQVQVKMKEMAAEMEVELMEQQKQMQQAVQEGKMIPERFELEMKKAQQMMQDQLQAAEQQYMSQLQAEASKIENKIISEKEYKVLLKDKAFQEAIVDAVQFYGTRIQQTICAGDKLLSEVVYPENVVDYPLIPFHYKWTGTPYPVSAVGPLVGKQKEINTLSQAPYWSQE